jgi:UDP-N-acetylmuramyl pentapeptide phosphotransferase/UDP-N-acetylglucosamine-1-phosphate transferase
LVAMGTSIVMNPLIIKLAFKKHLTDDPNHRKLQKKPIPVVGGMSVYLAFVVGLFIANLFYPTDQLYVVIAGMSIMFFLGLFDDMLDLSYKFKFVVQIGVIFLLWTFGYRLDTFVGLFGVNHIPMFWSCMLSLFAGVGLMNALNMIDGVDGLASGLGILTNTICGAYFITHHDPLFALLSIVFAGSLVPFFVCNVFSHKYKMFIGDSGSLIMGTLAYVLTCRVIHSPHLDWNDQYCVAMMLAIYALPVFDTLRVMGVRMLHGNSPFKPDRTHLHHMFVDLGYPHVMITAILLLIDSLVIGVWYLTSLYMESINAQFFVVIGTAIVLIPGLYIVLKLIALKKPELFNRFRAHAERASEKPIGLRNSICDLIDGGVGRRRKIRKAKEKAAAIATA